MNFDQLKRNLGKNTKEIKHKKIFRIILRKYYEDYKLNRRRLKLGKIIFEFNDDKANDRICSNEFEIKFANNNELIDDISILNQRLKDQDWQWTRSSVFSLTIVIIFLIAQIYCEIHNWIWFKFYFLFETNEFDCYFFKTIFELIGFPNNILTQNMYKHLNNFLLDVLIKFCAFYHLPM